MGCGRRILWPGRRATRTVAGSAEDEETEANTSGVDNRAEARVREKAAKGHFS